MLSTSLKLWTAAHQWAAENRKVLQKLQSDGSRLCFMSSSSFGKPITAALLKKFQKSSCKWTTFNEFQTHNYGMWTVVMPASNVRGTTCNCPQFMK